MTDKTKRSKMLRQIEINRLNEVYQIALDARTNENMLATFEISCQDIERISNEYNKQHNTIIGLLTTDEEFDIEDDVRKAFEKMLLTVRAMKHKLLKPQPQEAAPARTNAHYKVPKIALPTFSGDITTFKSYIGLFNSMIHNSNVYTPEEKFNYLLSSLGGYALSLVQHLPITEANYAIAYETIVKRYQGNRRILKAHWDFMANFRRVRDENADDIRELIDCFTKNLQAIKKFELPSPIDLADYMLLNLLLSKLDSTLVRRFEMEHKSDDIPRYDVLVEFLERQWIGLSSISQSKSERRVEKSFNKYKPASFFVGAQSPPRAADQTCACCDGSHTIYKCRAFNEKAPKARFDFVKENNLCINCLSRHNLRHCKSNSRCFYCKKPHHSLLHFDASPAAINNVDESQTSNTQSEHRNLQAFSSLKSNTEVLLSTAIIYLYDNDGQRHQARALIDSASQASFITLDCFNRIKLRKVDDCSLIQCLGSKTVKTFGATDYTIGSRYDDDIKFATNALIVNTISTSIPAAFVDIADYEHIRKLPLADPTFNVPDKVDLIVGADIFPHILLGSIKHSNTSQLHPSAINTVFGWIVMGGAHLHKATKIQQFFCSTAESALDNTLKSFWNLESFPKRNILSSDETLCEEIYKSTTSRGIDGRYCVSLPFRSPLLTLNDSRCSAHRQFLSLEGRLLKNPQLYSKYKDFMQDYIATKHMTRITNTNPSVSSAATDAYFIPHHGVMQHDKLRVVFNASCKTANIGPSLNDTLLPGRKLHNDLFTLLLRFRNHLFVFTTDIRQMFRQISVKPEHRKFQRIVWRFAPNMPVEEYELNTVTYGVVSSPYLANRTIIQLCEDEKDNFPRACEVLRNEIYVDDVATGAATLEDALIVKQEIISLLKKGGFELSKWAANDDKLLSDIPPEHLQQQPHLIEDKQVDHFVKILGLKWLPVADCFSFEIVESSEACTKRIVLSEIARVFDPIGFLAPVTFFAKHLMQHLWTLGLEWDEEVPHDVKEKWIQYKAELHLLHQIRIPRALYPNKNYVSCELHGFADSSERGYAAVVYFRYRCPDERVHITLVTAKTKVAPLNKVSIPKLELCAAVLLSDLIVSVRETYNSLMTIDATRAYTDSKVVLAWIKSSPHRWQTFVSNRVSHIQELVSPTMWFHVSSADNPADPASRGLMPSELIDHPLWWAGPSWLRDVPEQWPIESKVGDVVAPEMKIISFATVVQPSIFDELLERFSSLAKIQCILAYCFRVAYRSRNRSVPDASLTKEELLNALHALIRHVQSHYFADELQRLETKILVGKTLRKLNPFVDESGLLRVGGRLAHSQIDYDQKFPILLPNDHRLTHLIIEDCHRRHLHIGLNSLHFLLLQNYWILSPKRALRRCLSNCYRCFRARPTLMQPKMGDLPSFRISELKAFRCVGVDYAGPFNVTISKRRGVTSQKAYICLFVCATTKALHLELVTSLSMEAFLAAFHRFIGRRGLPTRIFSDCGTNFIAARKEIDSMCERSAHQLKIRWTLNPPSGPHFGGLFESGVKSVKTHIQRVVGCQVLTYEEFNTVLIQIEAVLNSRPLTPLSSDPRDLSVLTPGHFLTMDPLTALPEPDLSDIAINRLNRWQLLQRLHQDFWKRWHSEYLHTLQQRSKWHAESADINVGMLVLIAQDNASPLIWRTGRVLEMHRGPDGVCRVVTLRTSSGTVKRPVVKLSLLPNQH